MIEPTVLVGENGQKTLYRADLDETYHSTKGAIAESQHVFIQAGLNHCLLGSKHESLTILEIGFGTGLNALLTLHELVQNKIKVNYYALESHPLSYDLVSQLDYPAQLGQVDETQFASLHACKWDEPCEITPSFTLHKCNAMVQDFIPNQHYDLIYFDAFGPDKQPDMWELPVLEKLCNSLNQGGTFVTYSAKGDVRRNLLACDMKVEKLTGPPGKRHMLRATKN